MKIAIIGIRGIPFVYSGFESFAENLAVELAKIGWDITVYCRKQYSNKTQSSYKGVELITLPAIHNVYLETFSHSFFSTFHAVLRHKYDLILYFGVGNSIFAGIPRIFCIPTVINVDGMDWKREKWDGIGKLYLYLSSRISTILASKTITDSKWMYKYYLKKYNQNTVFIPYAIPVPRIYNTDILKKYQLKQEDYLLWVGRFVPENHLEELLQAYSHTNTNIKCVIVGDDLYNTTYRKQIKLLQHKDQRIIFTGFLPRNDYLALLQKAYAYIETKRSGGTHPSLIEAITCNKLIVANNHPSNKIVLGSCGVYYDYTNASAHLASTLEHITRLSSIDKKSFQNSTNKLVKKKYNWDIILQQYKNIFTHASKM